MNETKNYLKEYYSKREEIDLRELAKNVEQNSNEKTIKELKRTILRLQNEIDKENTKLHKEMDKSYSENYTPTEKRIVLAYRSKNGLKYFDIDNGLATELEDTDIKYSIDTKVGNVSIIVGYNFDLASIIIKTYKYSINTDNTQLTLKPLEINVVSFMENKGIRINISNGIITETNGLTNWYETYARISGKEFIDKFYGTDYKGTIPLIELRNYNLKNKAFEIIIKSAPQEIIDNILQDYEIEEPKPIHNILGIDKATYNKAVERGIIGYLYKCLKLIKTNKVNKSEMEWLDIIEDMKEQEDNLNFYSISYGTSWYYGSKDQCLLRTLLDGYCGSNALQNYYSFNKYCDYVVNETINQGYTSVNNFINELVDYLRMCESDDITPTLYSSYLRQTHDITSRNHKIKVEKESEDIFKSRYKDFKEFRYDKYYVIAPTETKDLQKEGDTLNHCVASYIKRVVENQCLIYFLRTNKEESLITFEVRNNAIVQVKGKHNRKPSDSEVLALQEFAKARGLETRF